MAAKRRKLLEEFESLESVASPSKAAKLHGMVANISPMKCSAGKAAYFEGKLADETTSLRMVGFDTAKQKEIAAFKDQKQTVTLDDCQIQQSRYGTDMEVIITNSTSILSSPKQIADDVVSSSILSSSQGVITLDQLQGMQRYETISVSAKVVLVSESKEVKPHLHKQDITLSDASGIGRLTLWQADIDQLKDGKSYEFKNLLVNSFNNVNYLSPPKSGFLFTPIDDIGVVEDAPMNQDESNELRNCTVSVVSQFHRWKLCRSCKSGRVTPKNDRIGQCTCCSARQLLDKCDVTISATVSIDSEGEVHSLQASLCMMQSIAGDTSMTEDTNEDTIIEALLLAAPFSVKFKNNSINAVYR